MTYMYCYLAIGVLTIPFGLYNTRRLVTTTRKYETTALYAGSVTASVLLWPIIYISWVAARGRR